MMKAVRIHAFGGPDAPIYENVPTPKPAADEVLVRIHAAGVNSDDWKVREGKCGPMKLPHTLGCDFSGVIEAVGPGVRDFVAGQSVFGHASSGGAFAEFCVVPVCGVAPKPSSLDDLEAAAIPLCGLTAWQALFTTANLQSGQSILIHGAAGAAGLLAVQLALRKGARVIGTVSNCKDPFLDLLGLEQVIVSDFTRLENMMDPVDVVLDFVGDSTQDQFWNVLKSEGCLVSIISTPSKEMALRRGVEASKMPTQIRSDELTLLGELMAECEIEIILDEPLPLSQAALGLERNRCGLARGKVVLEVEHAR